MIRVGLVGCGLIAGGLDDPGTEHVLTHAKAIRLHPGFRLAACCDPDRARAEDLAGRWGRPEVFTDLEEMIGRDPEVYVVAASSGAHFQIMKTLLSAGPSLIICEKPLVDDLEQLDVLERMIAASKTKVLVNFQRRFDPAMRRLKRVVRSGELGQPCFFQAGVGKGMIHNGCHLVDLLFDLLSPVVSLEPCRAEWTGGDVFGSFAVSLKSGVSGLVQNTDRVEYGLLDAEIFFSRGRVSIREIGYRILVEKRKPWGIYPGFHHLTPQEAFEPTLNRVFYELYEAVAGGKIDYDGLLNDALAGTRLLLQLKGRCS